MKKENAEGLPKLRKEKEKSEFRKESLLMPEFRENEEGEEGTEVIIYLSANLSPIKPRTLVVAL